MINQGCLGYDVYQHLPRIYLASVGDQIEEFFRFRLSDKTLHFLHVWDVPARKCAYSP